MPTVTASSFADPGDLAAYKRAIERGMTPDEALAVGDNGKGCWGDDTTSLERPACALPPEDWEEKWGSGKSARGKKVVVTYKDKSVPGYLLDTMKHKANIKNGAGIDLGPGFAHEFGVHQPFMLKDVTWEWGE